MPETPAKHPTSAGSLVSTRPLTVVTGGSEGIGLAIARLLTERGHRVLLIARRPGPLEDAARSLRAAHLAADVTTLSLDVTRSDACDVLDAELGWLGSHVEILVNAAGTGQSGDFSEADPQVLDLLMTLNMAVPSRLMRHVLPGMRARGSGGILNIASLGGYAPGPYQAAYYASKAYLISLSEAVAAEVRQDGVRVTVVAPGPVDTDFHAKMGAERAIYRRFLPSSSPESVARWAVRGFELGLKVVVPGAFNLLGAVALRLLPHVLLVPFMAWLLDPRRPT
ncbi:MAG: SDR family NAD(P)-dependent oxidoreductase [Hyphomicrobiaceae bacterium]